MQRFLSFFFIFALLFSHAAYGQGDDLSLEGDEPAAAESSGDGESEDEGNLVSNYFKKGGIFIYFLVGLSVILLGLVIYCIIDLSKRNFYPEKIITGLEDDFSRADLAHALERSKNSTTCLGQVTYSAVEYIGDRGYQVLDDNGLYDAMADASQEFNRGRARMINYLSVIAQAAPMLGLLGTVSGMIKAFDKLGDDGMQPSVLAGDISEALLTTATGLVIALPALFCYFFFRDMLTGFVSRTDRHAFRLLNTLRRAIVAQSAAAHGHGQSAKDLPDEQGDI